MVGLLLIFDGYIMSLFHTYEDAIVSGLLCYMIPIIVYIILDGLLIQANMYIVNTYLVKATFPIHI